MLTEDSAGSQASASPSRLRLIYTKVCITPVVDGGEEVLDGLLVAEEVEGRRVLLQRVVDHSILVCYDQDTVIVPILAKVLAVEKRLMLQAVLYIRTRRVETH